MPLPLGPLYLRNQPPLLVVTASLANQTAIRARLLKHVLDTASEPPADNVIILAAQTLCVVIASDVVGITVNATEHILRQVCFARRGNEVCGAR